MGSTTGKAETSCAEVFESILIELQQCGEGHAGKGRTQNICIL